MFNYLAGHPQIRASAAKETRFFLDADYPLRSERCYEKDGAAAYLSFFGVAAGEDAKLLRLEATPDYLYSPGTPQSIFKALPNVRFVFLLREPVSRLLSFYQFGQQLNEIPQSMTFDRFIELQRNNSVVEAHRKYSHPVFQALSHGRYSLYLKPFLDLFGRSMIHVAFYEELRRDPRAFMCSICQWAGIDETYFQDYSFEVKNKGFKARSPWIHRAYFEGRQRARSLVRGRPQLRSALRHVGRRLNLAYRKMNATAHKDVVMSRSTREFISAYYQEEPARLRKLLDIEVAWN